MTRPDTDRQHVGRTDVGRADLIRLYAKLEDETRFQRVAEAMGYRKELDDIEVLSDTVIVRDHIDGIVTSKPVAGGVRHRHYRLVERRALAPPPPPSPVKLPPPDEEEPVAPLGPSPPLIPWPRLWPFLRAALGNTPNATASTCAAWWRSSPAAGPCGACHVSRACTGRHKAS